ncbi:putative transcription factor interactor and regulator CCHC(Zn) family [Helianthus anomalus]
MRIGANQKKETRTCYRCQEVGHIAWNCPKATNIKQEVVSKLKEKVVEKNEPPTERFKVFKIQHMKLESKSDEKSGDESDSTKSEEPQVDVKIENSVPPMDDVNLPPLRAENLKSKKEFDVEKAFNGNVKKIFGKMVEGKAKGVKEFYVTKKATYTPSEVETEKETSKFGLAWMAVFHK